MVWVKKPSASMAMVPPMMSGRASWSVSIGPSIMWRNRSGSLSRPWMTWTKPASSLPPSSIIVTSSQSWKVTSPSKRRDVSSHQALCSGRLELRSADSRESKRTTPTNSSSSVMPYVPPSQPMAPCSSSSLHRSICRWIASASWHRPWMTWMNTMNLPFQIGGRFPAKWSIDRRYARGWSRVTRRVEQGRIAGGTTPVGPQVVSRILPM